MTMRKTRLTMTATSTMKISCTIFPRQAMQDNVFMTTISSQKAPGLLRISGSSVIQTNEIRSLLYLYLCNETYSSMLLACRTSSKASNSRDKEFCTRISTTIDRSNLHYTRSQNIAYDYLF